MTVSETRARPQAAIPAARFDLRPLRGSDAGLIALYAGDERVARMTTSIPHPFPPGAAEAFIARALADGGEQVWAMDGTRTGLGELLGLISLKHTGEGSAAIGYWVAPALWHLGYASEAVEAMVAANPTGLRVLRAEVFQCNPVSARVLTRAGFRHTGEAESFSVAQNRTVPTWTYEIDLPATSR